MYLKHQDHRCLHCPNTCASKHIEFIYARKKRYCWN